MLFRSPFAGDFFFSLLKHLSQGCLTFIRMKFICKLLFSWLLSYLLYNSASAQFKPLRGFLSHGYSILASAAGDLNQDGKMDLVVILRNRYERINTDTTRRLLLLAGNGQGKYRLMARNDSVVLCRGCGGVYGDPFAGIVVPVKAVLPFQRPLNTLYYSAFRKIPELHINAQSPMKSFNPTSFICLLTPITTSRFFLAGTYQNYPKKS